MTSGQPWEELLERLNQASVQFALTELDVTLSIMDRADLFSDAGQRKQAYSTARHSYETASRCLVHLTFTDLEQLEISAKVRRIEQRLHEGPD
jgi:hypothetical protein